MSINPFDGENGSFSLLVDGELQLSLWPTPADVGLDDIERKSPDIRPEVMRERPVSGGASNN